MLLRALLAVIISLAHSPIARAAASSCTSSAPPVDARIIRCKYLIVGGGPGGMFSAYLLRSLGRDLCVVERSSMNSLSLNYVTSQSPSAWPETLWGGKMMDFPAPALPAQTPKRFGTCGLRINVDQKNMRCLMSQLNITMQKAPVESLFYARGKWVRDTQQLVPPEGLSYNVINETNVADSLEGALLGYTLLGQPVNPLTGNVTQPHPETLCGNYANVNEYMLDALGPEAAQFLMDSNRFAGTWTEPKDVCAFIVWNKYQNLTDGGFDFYPIPGFSAVYDTIKSMAAKQGVRFFSGSNITSLYKLGSSSKYRGYSYMATMDKPKAGNIIGWAADRLIINSGIENLALIKGPLGCKLYQNPHVQGQFNGHVIVYNAYYSSRFWEAYQTQIGTTFRVIAHDLCTSSSEFPGHPYVMDINASRPIYSDDPNCVAMWLALYDQGGIQAVRDQVESILRTVLPGVNVPKPTADVFYTANFAKFLKPFQTERNITIDTVAEWGAQPLGPNSNLCLVGEAYSMQGAGWTLGPFLSVLNCIKANFLDVLSKEAQSNITYIESGCGGATSFPNEVLDVPSGPLNSSVNFTLPTYETSLKYRW